MSIAAMNWAMNQRTGSPSGQCVLYVLADVADPEGMCFPSLGYIADRSQQSRDTVRRRLNEMEDSGLLVRFERHDKKERQKTDEIRLQMGVYAVSMSEPDKPESGNEKHPENGENPSRGEGGNLLPRGSTRATGGVAMVPPHEPPLNQESNPHTPFQKGAVGISDQNLEKRVEAFKRVYPCKTTKPLELARLISALTETEAETVTLAGSGYAVHCAKLKRTPLDPVKFVRDVALWDEFAPLAPKPQPEKIFVERGSRQWAALCVLNAICDGENQYLPRMAPPGCAQAEGRTGALVSDQVDLEAMDSLAEFADEFGRPDFETWRLCTEKTKQWWAWNNRAKRCGYEPLEASLHETGETYEKTLLGGRVETFPKRISGVMVPREWPPRLTRDDGEADADEAADAGVDDALGQNQDPEGIADDADTDDDCQEEKLRDQYDEARLAP